MPVARNLQDAVEEIIHDHRGHAGGGLVQHEQPGLGHQRPADCHLLALAAGELAGGLAPSLLQDREEVEDPRHGVGDALGADVGAHLQVFLDGHGGEDVALLRHKAHALAHALLRAQPGDVLAVEPDRALPQHDHAEDRLHRGRLARAVGPHDHGDLTLLGLDGAVADDVRAAIAAGHAFAGEKAHDAPAPRRRPRPR